jgi:hypothetical protein
MYELQLRHQPHDACLNRIGHAGRDGQGRLLEGGDNLFHRQPANPMRSQREGEVAPRDLRPRRGMGRCAEDRPQPRFVRRRTQREPWRIDSIQLLAQPVGESSFLDVQFFDHAH